jgi:hypothetical protein
VFKIKFKNGKVDQLIAVKGTRIVTRSLLLLKNHNVQTFCSDMCNFQDADPSTRRPNRFHIRTTGRRSLRNASSRNEDLSRSLLEAIAFFIRSEAGA